MSKLLLILTIILLIPSTLLSQELPEEVYELADKLHREKALTHVSRDTLHSMFQSGDWSYYRLGDPYFSYSLTSDQCKLIKSAPGVLNLAYLESVYFPVIVDDKYVMDRIFKYYEEKEKWGLAGEITSRSLLKGTIDSKFISCIDDIALVTIHDQKMMFLMVECDDKFYVRTFSYYEMFGMTKMDWTYNPLIPFEEAWPVILDSFPKKAHEMRKGG